MTKEARQMKSGCALLIFAVISSAGWCLRVDDVVSKSPNIQEVLNEAARRADAQSFNRDGTGERLLASEFKKGGNMKG